MTVPLTDSKIQLVAIGVEYFAQLPTPVIAGGVPYFWHTEETFPYLTCRTGADTVEWDSEDFDRDTYTLILRLVVGHLTADYKGQNEANLDTWIPGLKTYINERELLQSVSYPDPVDGLIRARVVSINGFAAFQNSGLAVTQVGTEIIVETLWDETISQAYL